MSIISDPVIQKAVASIKQRSEKQRDIQKSIESFVDLGVFPQIATENNQIIYGRRGTGKTHLFQFLGVELSKQEGTKVVYIDCRTLGSTSQFADLSLPIEHRCLALFRDILAEVHDALLDQIIERPTGQADDVLNLLSQLAAAVTRPVSEERVSSRESKITAATESKSGGKIEARSGLFSGSLEGGSTSAASREMVVNSSLSHSDKVIFPERLCNSP